MSNSVINEGEIGLILPSATSMGHEEGKTPDHMNGEMIGFNESIGGKEGKASFIGDTDKALFESPLTMWSRLFQIKSMESLQKQGANSELKRALRGVDLIAIGIGHLIGTGIFVLTGK